MALRGRRLLVTCYENNTGAVASFDYDDASGEISGPIDISEAFFQANGAPKGIAFNRAGDKVFVTFVTEKAATVADKCRIVKDIFKKNGIVPLFSFLHAKMFSARPAGRGISRALSAMPSNGVAIFAVDQRGNLSSEPVSFAKEQNFCRLENISLTGNLCVITDPVNHEVLLYDFDGEHIDDTPFQVIRERMEFPHDACFSADGELLFITHYGLGVLDGRPQWGRFTEPRGDKISIYARGEA